jgi:hypothetical protein
MSPGNGLQVWLAAAQAGNPPGALALDERFQAFAHERSSFGETGDSLSLFDERVVQVDGCAGHWRPRMTH